MILKKIRIENFKSIDKLEFEIKKYGSSYTVAFVGINEVGKSNILKAMSFLETPEEEFDFLDVANQNNDTAEFVNIFFEMVPEQRESYQDYLKERITTKENFIDNIQIERIEKNVYLKRGEQEFSQHYKIDFKNINLNSFWYKGIEETVIEGSQSIQIIKYEIKKESELSTSARGNFQELDLEKLSEIVADVLESYFMKFENEVSFWKPDEKHLITSTIDLMKFKEDLSENIPLRNIFYLAGYKTEEEIKTKIEEIERNGSQLRRLEKQLTKKSTEYLNSVWKEHMVKVDFRITDQLQCDVKIKDKGEKNDDNFFVMQSRSDGFKQFASLIFTISIEHTTEKIKNRLILIDEPENHLHPSGVRYIRDELIKIGRGNYVFLSTHSNFIIDNKVMQRNVVIKKDSNNNTFKEMINDYNDIKDDEVLKDAFGINVFVDFLTPNKLLVEGKSDKIILEKCIKKIDPNLNFAITNGTGDNLPAMAGLLNYQEISSLVVVDADKKGEQNKNKIIKIGSIFSKKNVFTIRNIEGNLIENSTIEDTLPREFVVNKFKEIYKLFFNRTISPTFEENNPIISEIRLFLQKDLSDDDKPKINELIRKLKIELSNGFDPTNLEGKTPLLYSLTKKIIEKLKK